ncbi:MarR family winged helix-turn-helix transcriptional regulator [Micromonospora profundi]|uniref:MarR family winged helix-turn-helix transcriptional regulator n=1 Tax=Micromonospora profundi TaxID=1420889 RepID=UPI00365D1BD5
MSTPTLTGQVIGQAHYATRALLERAAAPLGVSFGQVLALNVLAGGPVERDRLVQRITGTLKVDAPAVQEIIAGLVDAGLAHSAAVDGGASVGGPEIRLTDTGRAVQGRIAKAVGDITTRLYGDIPADEAATVARVLTLVTQRANAELAALPASSM